MLRLKGGKLNFFLFFQPSVKLDNVHVFLSTIHCPLSSRLNRKKIPDKSPGLKFHFVVAVNQCAW
jgi:hypothetical protein